jgi:hypothetical protein
MFRIPLAKTATSHVGGTSVDAVPVASSTGEAQLPWNPGAFTSATRRAAESGCSGRVPNSVVAVLGAPAPVFPPWAM